MIDDFSSPSAEKKAFEESDNDNFVSLGMCIPCEDKQHNMRDQCERKEAILCCTYITYVTNQNIGSSKNELLYWYQKLCVHMQDLQLLTKPHNVRYQEGNVIIRQTVIPTKYKYKANLKREDFPLCLACKLTTMKATSAEVVTTKTAKSKEGSLSCDKYGPGDSISTN